jgi:polyisoprenoid-binding protein YceI
MSTTLQQVPAGTYAIDPVHSTAGFAIKHNGISTFRTRFADFDAALVDGVLTGSVQVASVDIAEENFKGHLLSEEFFNTAVTPTVTFRSTDIRIDDSGAVEIAGRLTIKGITKDVVARGEAAVGAGLGGDERVAFDLETTLDRRDYGLNWQMATPSGADAAAWDVKLEVHVELVKA